jgi:fermentation-respiration switch protein FrsA (DUF1100 family)
MEEHGLRSGFRQVRNLLSALAAAATASCSMLESLEREMVFRPVTQEWRGYSPAIVNAEEHWIPVGSEGERLHAWWIGAPQAEFTLLYFHGARVNLSGSIYRLRAFRDAGFNVIAFDYRGFGRSSPRLPSEQSAYEDAEAAVKWFESRVPDARRRILYGHSLGGPMSAEAALRGSGAAALVLESTFTSVSDMTRLSGLVTQRLDVLEKVERLSLPVLIVHGAEDDLVPPEMAKRLYQAARGPKRLLIVEGAGHRWVAFRARDSIFAQLRELTGESATR